MESEIFGPVDVFEYKTNTMVNVDLDTISFLRRRLMMGLPWDQVLFEAIGMWTTPSEEFMGQTNRYVIQGEAFDWMLLAQRLYCEVEDLIPDQSMERLLLRGELPFKNSINEPENFLGFNKYRAVLNYWYGVVLEECLILTVEDEVRKDMRGSGRVDLDDVGDEPFLRIYAKTRSNLVKEFRRDMGYPLRRISFNLGQYKEFLYWLFKLRIRYWDPARVASDTRKALASMLLLRGSTSPFY